MFKPRYLLLCFLIAGSVQFPSSTYAQAPTPTPTPAPVAGLEERDRGIELFRQKNFKEAAKLLKKAVSKNKLDEKSWYYLGLVHMQQPKSLKDASKAFETAVILKPDFAAAHAALSYSLLRRDKAADALREARIAVSLDPASPHAHYVISVVNLNARIYEEALRESSAAIRVSPDLAAAYLVRSQALIGLYATRIRGLAPRSRPTPPVPPTPEERVERRRKHKEEVAPLVEAFESLETFLKLSSPDSETAHWREQLETLRAFANLDAENTSSEAVVFGDEVTTKARVLSKPEPSYTESARRAQVTGTVVLRAVFAADGGVRNILVIEGLPNGLTERAIAAARLIRFTPAMIDGKAVSMFIQLEYNFNLY